MIALTRGIAAAALLVVIGTALFQQYTGLSAEAIELRKQQHQRDLAQQETFRDEVDSLLKNAATATESYATSHEGSYEGIDLRRLQREGLFVPPGLELSHLEGTAKGYCLQVTHAGLPEDDEWHVATYSSAVGQPLPDDTC